VSGLKNTPVFAKYLAVVLLFGIGLIALLEGSASDGYVVIDGWMARIFGAALMVCSVLLGLTSNKPSQRAQEDELPPDFGI
jgi:hypothetical protein